MMETKNVLEIISAFIMVGALIGLLWERYKTGRGMGIRAIQFLAICFVFPSLLILGLEQRISQEAVATLLGTIVGYVLSGIGQDDRSKE
jgi:predicted acyltransferase